MTVPGPLVLAILDGWGIAPPGPGNAVTQARTPNLDRFRQQYPWVPLQAGGSAVGLSPAQDGNSEAGHMNIGAGRVVPQESVRISESINNGTFFRNPAFLAAMHHVEKHGSTLHLIGMLGSNQSAHADPDHLLALLILAQNHRLPNVRLHLFTDGRDSPRFFAREMITRLQSHLGDARLATVMGRFFAMDRNKNWDRTAATYRAMTTGQAAYRVADGLEAVTRAYNRGETDEFITPTVVGGYTGMDDHDAVIFFNLRSDRARQLTKAFVQANFEVKNAATKPFTRPRILHHLTFVAMTDFGPDLDSVLTAFPAVTLIQTFPMVMAPFRQLYIAESEKYAHVTYFFNGGYADPVAGEERRMIASPAVKNYDAVPAMSSGALTAAVCQALEQNQTDVVVMNFANTDMVAHTGNLLAGIAALEAVDDCLGRIADVVLRRRGLLAVTGDHGNLEEMINVVTNEIDTEHSANPVPFMLVSAATTGLSLRLGGSLCDIAPTLIGLKGLPVPPEMTGRNLLEA